jgi:hypothetical protein
LASTSSSVLLAHAGLVVAVQLSALDDFAVYFGDDVGCGCAVASDKREAKEERRCDAGIALTGTKGCQPKFSLSAVQGGACYRDMVRLPRK